MNITVIPPKIKRGCHECLMDNRPMFVVTTVTNTKLQLCERCMKEATLAITSIAIEARKRGFTYGK